MIRQLDASHMIFGLVSSAISNLSSFYFRSRVSGMKNGNKWIVIDCYSQSYTEEYRQQKHGLHQQRTYSVFTEKHMYVCMYVYVHTHTYIEKPKSYPARVLVAPHCPGWTEGSYGYPFLNSAAWRAVWRVKLHIPLAFYRKKCICFKALMWLFRKRSGLGLLTESYRSRSQRGIKGFNIISGEWVIIGSHRGGITQDERTEA